MIQSELFLSCQLNILFFSEKIVIISISLFRNKKKAFLALLFFAITCNANEDAKRLLDDLFANYNNMVRPVANPADIIKLHLGIKLSQIADIVSF